MKAGTGYERDNPLNPRSKGVGVKAGTGYERGHPLVFATGEANLNGTSVTKEARDRVEGGCGRIHEREEGEEEIAWV